MSKIKSIIGIYEDGSKHSFNLDNIDEMRIQEFKAVEIIETITKEEYKKLYEENII